MAKSRKAYVDSSAFIAFLDRSDSHHLLFARFFSDPPELITSALVIAETHGWFLKRFDSGKAISFLNFIEDLKALSIVSVGQSEVQSTHKIIREFSDQPLSLVDASGLALMKTCKVRSCWSTDRHLTLTGVPLVIHDP